VDLNEVAAYVVQTLEPIAETAHASIVLNKLEGPARIRGDREEVALVLQNLVQNAIKYGRDDGGRVEVTVGRGTKQGQRAPRLEVVIADNGQGIAPEHLPRLTERFYRASVASSRAKGGTGL